MIKLTSDIYWKLYHLYINNSYFSSGGNQRDLARAKNAKKNQDHQKKKSAIDKVSKSSQ